jgi:hypothetical protein
MAGPGVLNAATMRAEQQRQPARLRPASFSRQHLVEASLTIEGRTFRTLVREGTPVNALIEKVARENGGSVEKVFYPSLNASEIVSVRIGDVCLVKSGTEGLHFYLGSSGIPFASLPSGIVFPNGDELRVRHGAYDIHLGKTGDNFDPQKLSDFGARYEGGASMSFDAAKKAAAAHGDSRTEKLLLPDNLLVIDKETGEIRTASEHAAKIAVEGFGAPQFQAPAYTSVGLTMSSERGVLAIPMDGSATRVPYLFVKTFDGRIADHLSVRFSQLKADAAHVRFREAATRSSATGLYFSAMHAQAAAPAGAPSASQPSPAQCQPQPLQRLQCPGESFPRPVRQPACFQLQSTGHPRPALQSANTARLRAEPVQSARERARVPFHDVEISPEAIRYFWHHPVLPQKEGIRSFPPVPGARFTAPAAAEKAAGKKAGLKAGGDARARPAREKKKPKNKQKRKAKPKLAPVPSLRKRKSASQPPPAAGLLKKSGKKAKEADPLRRTGAGGHAAMKKQKRAKNPFQRTEAPRTGAVRRKKEVRKALEAAPSMRHKAPAAHKSRHPNAKKKGRGMPAYFMMGLLGLLPKAKKKGKRFSRGTASAGN